MFDTIRVCDINPQLLEPPFSLQLARAVSTPYLKNGARTFGFHLAPYSLGKYYLTTIIDETSPYVDEPEAALMVQTGAQYGCSVRRCPFCVFSTLPFQRNLNVCDMVDMFRLALYVHSQHYDHSCDQRQLVLKLTDNGEPLENMGSLFALDNLQGKFGVAGKILRLKISTILNDSPKTREVFQKLVDWQRENMNRFSIHLQISVVPGVKGLIGAEEVREMVAQWADANPRDRVCFAPGLVQGFDEAKLLRYCQAMTSLSDRCFFRLSVIKPSCEQQEQMILDRRQLIQVNQTIEKLGFITNPLPQNNTCNKQLRAVGTLSHLPGDGNFYDPATYQIWNSCPGAQDPNTPL